MSNFTNISGNSGLFVPVLDNYARLSQVPDTGELEKIVTQHADNRIRINEVGGKEGLQLSDGLSAWNPKVRRKAWETVLDRARRRITNGICVWHTDRLFRLPRDLEALIELADKGFLIISSHGVRDLSNSDDRYNLRIEVAQAARSSDDISRRVKRRFATRRAKGVAHAGGRAFGWPGCQRRKKGDRLASIEAGIALEPMPLISDDQVQRERRAIDQGTQEWLVDNDLTAIARSWNAQGLRTATGLPFQAMDVRFVFLHARNAGLVEHNEEIVGDMVDAEKVRIIPPERYYRIRAKLLARRRGTQFGEKAVATGIMLCGICGNSTYTAKASVSREGTVSRVYRCRKDRYNGCGRVSAAMHAVDAEIRRQVIDRLSDTRFASAIAAARQHADKRLEHVNTEISECEEVQAGLTERLGRREITKTAFDRANLPLVKDLQRLYGERDGLLRGDLVERIATMDASEVATMWDGATIPQRAQMLRRALGTDRLVLHKATRKGYQAFNPHRVRMEPSSVNIPHESGGNPETAAA